MTGHKPDDELHPDDELGMIEAAEIPQGQAPSDNYVIDPNYDESLAELDPDEQGAELPHSEEEWKNL